MVRFVTLGRIVPTIAAVARSFAKSAHPATEAIFIATTAHQRCERVVKEKLTSDTEQQARARISAACKVRDGTAGAVVTP
jgi:hypothetical protein